MKIADIKAMSSDELQAKLTELKDKLFKQKIQKSIGQHEKGSKIRETRKDIARILTVFNEQKRGK
jgi:large subunit ribosomal protein L29